MKCLMLLIVTIREPRTSFHSFVSSMSVINVLKFSVYKSFTSLVKFVPGYFIISDVIVNGIVFFISLSVVY